METKTKHLNKKICLDFLFTNLQQLCPNNLYSLSLQLPPLSSNLFNQLPLPNLCNLLSLFNQQRNQFPLKFLLLLLHNLLLPKETMHPNIAKGCRKISVLAQVLSVDSCACGMQRTLSVLVFWKTMLKQFVNSLQETCSFATHRWTVFGMRKTENVVKSSKVQELT